MQHTKLCQALLCGVDGDVAVHGRLHEQPVGGLLGEQAVVAHDLQHSCLSEMETSFPLHKYIPASQGNCCMCLCTMLVLGTMQVLDSRS